MTTDSVGQMQKELKGIARKHFPVWSKTMGYERGLPHFREPPQFSEEGVLVPATGEYTCRRRWPTTSETVEVEQEDNSPPMPMVLPLAHNEYGMHDLVLDPLQQIAWAPTQPPAAEHMTSLLQEHDALLEGPVYDQDPEYSTMEDGEQMQLDHWHNEPMASFQPQMADLSGMVSNSTPPYDTDI